MRSKLIRRTFVAAAVVVGSLGVMADPASATVNQNQDWIAGYPMSNVYQPEGWACTAGPQFLGTATGHYYQAMPRHCLESYYNTNTFVDMDTSDPYPTFVSAEFMMDPNNNFTVGSVGFPWGSGYTLYDMAIVDLGPVWAAVAGTDLVKNWCHPYPSCEGPLGGGWFSATFGQGYHMQTAGPATPWVGMLSCHSGRNSGTACGTTVSAHWVTAYGGYQQWLWRVTGVGNCGEAKGDSGAPVYWTEDAQNVYMAGMIVASPNSYTNPSRNGCYAAGQVYSTEYYYIPWTSIRDGFPGLGLTPLV
jgi:hypothetical protein